MPAVCLRLFQIACVALLLGALLAAPARAQDGEEAASEAQAAPSNIESRLRRIEDTLIDMRAMIGALQSFAPGDGANQGQMQPPRQTDQMPGSGMSDDPFADSGDPFGQPEDPLAGSAPQPPAGPSPELQQLEIQVQALSAQLSEAVQRLNRLEAALGQSDADGMNGAAQLPPTEGESADMAEQEADPDPAMGFGTTTVETPTAPEEDFGAWEDETMSAPADEAGSPDAQALFAQAYDALQVQDYAAARDSFEAFLDTYPDDPLANDARYWLADAAFAEGDYVVAANNFVRVYNTAPTGEKSEETLLKLAVVLRRLERPESACDALSRLDGRLDGMPDSFRERVANERQRSGCG
jgi:tol-pal system protein YbgF